MASLILLKNQVNHSRYQTSVQDLFVDAWLLTNGYNNGIVQLVGQAVYKVKLIKPDQKLTAIGVCQWGCIHGPDFKSDLKDEENEEVWRKSCFQNEILFISID